MNDGWTFAFEGWDPDARGHQEALTTLGNGYVATRGADEESTADGVHYPGTYLAGGYDRLVSEVAGRQVENEDLVNWPNWLPLTFRPEDGDWLAPGAVEILERRVVLRLDAGCLERSLCVRDARGRETRIDSTRIVHLGSPHLAAIAYTITPLGWSGRIEVRSTLDGTVTNAGVPRYADLRGDHLVAEGEEPVGEDTVLLTVRTRRSRIRMAQAARLLLFDDHRPAPIEDRRIETSEGRIEDRVTTRVTDGRPLHVEKVVAIYTCRDAAVFEPRHDAREAAAAAPRIEALLRSQASAWARMWRLCDLQLAGDGRTTAVLRLHVFHLLQTTSLNSVSIDMGVPARGLHGEAYRGHVFWDEVFILPFLNLRLPEISRHLLLYRHRRLEAARRAASAAGLRGALFPWQSGSSGREESQVVHLNPRSGRWIPDDTHLQRHVNGAIAYNVWKYYEATGDLEFLRFYGAEILLETARLFASLATWDSDLERFRIRGVVGPDEYHTAYPDSERPGLDDNAYTNVLAAWVLATATGLLDSMDPGRREELLDVVRAQDEEVAEWERISRRLRVPFHEDGIISQFDGYEALEELDWEGLRERHGDIHRLDRVLEAEGDTPNRYKASKQADVLMLLYLFSAEELETLFERLGYALEPDWIQKNVGYYLARTSHGSTLSAVVHAWIAARSDRERSWDLFLRALRADVDDVQGGTTAEGIHLGAMAGAIDLVGRCYLGIELHEETLWLNPCLPDPVERLALPLCYRDQWVDVEVTHDRVRVVAREGRARAVRVGYGEDAVELTPGEAHEFTLAERCEVRPRAR